MLGVINTVCSSISQSGISMGKCLWAGEDPKVRAVTTGCAGLLALLRLLLCGGEAVQRDYPRITAVQPFIIFLGR